MITWLEFEVSPDNKLFFFENWLVNLEGEEGRSIEGDIMQEHLNFDLEEGVEQKGQDFGGAFMRDILSRAIHHLGRLKNAIRPSLGLAKKGWKHTEPHNRPEIRTLLRTYEEAELHLFREGRRYTTGRRCVNDFTRGAASLRDGKLDKWLKERAVLRGVGMANKGTVITINELGGVEVNGEPRDEAKEGGEADVEVNEDGKEQEEGEDGSDMEEPMEETQVMTRGRRVLVDGELIFMEEGDFAVDSIDPDVEAGLGTMEDELEGSGAESGLDDD